MTDIKLTNSNVTLDIGADAAPDKCQVSVSYRLSAPGINFSTNTGATVLLPPGTIVKSPIGAEKQARIEAADLLDEVAAFLRKEAGT